MKPQRFILLGDSQRAAAVAAVNAAKVGNIVTIAAPSRSSAQNALLHKWFSEISVQRGDVSMMDVKAEANLEYGRPIKVRDDPEWEVIFGYLFDKLDYRRKVKAIKALDVPFTRNMNVTQLTEYMDAFSRDSRQQGFVLTEPDELVRG